MRFPDYEDVETDDPQAVLDDLKLWFDNIVPQRKENLKGIAKTNKGKGFSLEKAMSNMKSFAEKNKRFGPTDEELTIYNQFCQELYSTE